MQPTTPDPERSTPQTPDEAVDVVAREVQRLSLDLARVVAENGILAARVAVLEAALQREAVAPSVRDERVAIALKPNPKPKFVPVVLPAPKVGRHALRRPNPRLAAALDGVMTG